MTSKSSDGRDFIMVAVDGGAASGKSSTSRVLADRLNLLHVDTGSHYRAITHACLAEGLSARDGQALCRFLGELRFETRLQGKESVLVFAGRETPAPSALRSDRINQVVSAFAALDPVRSIVKSYQRSQVDIARNAGFGGIVMDGRDIGTVILPDADLKVFLRADPGVRQQRRILEGAVDTISSRDQCDASRSIAPLKAAATALVIDNSRLSLEEVVELIVKALLNPTSDA